MRLTREEKTKGPGPCWCLEPLSEIILCSGLKLNEIQIKHEKDFINLDMKITSFEDALRGKKYHY